MNKDETHIICSESTGKPFTHCNVCDKSLDDGVYFIEKAYQRNLSDYNHFVVFEIAICMQCRANMAQNISKESMQKMQNYMKSYEGEMLNTDREISLDQCSFTQRPVKFFEEYHVLATIEKDNYIIPPIVMGGDIMKEYQEILSEETKGFFRDFYNDFIGVPPSLAKLLNKDITPVVF